MSGVHSSRAPVVVVLPWVAVEVDLPLDLEVVIPLEILTVLRLLNHIIYRNVFFASHHLYHVFCLLTLCFFLLIGI
jgi:hypothetical protein